MPAPVRTRDADLRAAYRVGPPTSSPPISRATPVLHALSIASRGRRRGMHGEAVLGPVTFAVEGGHSRQALDHGAAWDAAPRDLRPPSWRNAKELAVAAAADWSLGDGKLRLGGGVDRVRIADAALSRGGTGAVVMVAEADYLAATRWSLGGGWRSTGVSAKGNVGDRLVSLAHGAPIAATGAFVHGAFTVDDRLSLQAEAAMARLRTQNAALFDGLADRRGTITLRYLIP